MIRKARRTIKRITTLIISIFLLVFTFIIKNNTDLCEKFSRTVNRWWIYAVGHFSSLFSFSIAELLIILAIILFIISIIFTIIYFKKKNKKGRYSITDFLLTVLIVFSLYSFLSTPVYNRKELDIQINEHNINNDQVLEVANYYLLQMNEIGKRIKKDENGSADMEQYFTFEELNDLLETEYRKLNEEYFSPYTPRAKKVINSWLLTETGVTGFEFILTGEANINSDIPDIDIPFTMAHELAHTKGIMREDDCNLLATYICLKSDNDFIKYSGLFRSFSHILNMVYYTRSYTDYCEFYKTIPTEMLVEEDNYFAYWGKKSFLDKVQDWINDIYLKFNGNQNGIESYKDPSTNTDTGEKYDDGSPIYHVDFSKTQKLLIELCYAK